MNPEIIKTLQELIIKIDPKLNGTFNVEASLDKELPVDSLDSMSLLLELEEKYKIKISVEDTEKYNLIVINKLLKYIENKLNDSISIKDNLPQ